MILNTDTRIYLIKFQFCSTNGKFMFSDALELVNILRNKDKHGIEYLKEFDSNKNTFKRISVKDFLRFNKYETEAIEYLKTHYYFKKFIKPFN